MYAVIQPAGREVVNKKFGFLIELALSLLSHFKAFHTGKPLFAYLLQELRRKA